MYRVCTLRSDFSNLPRNKLSRRKSSEGKEYYYFEALLRMKLSNEVRLISPNWVCVGGYTVNGNVARLHSQVWVFESFYEGKACGVVQAKYM